VRDETSAARNSPGDPSGEVRPTLPAVHDDGIGDLAVACRDPDALDVGRQREELVVLDLSEVIDAVAKELQLQHDGGPSL
jgi:hypothetical protein